MALSVSRSVGSEVQISNIDGADKGKRASWDPGDMWVLWMRGDRAKRTGGPCTSGGDGTTEAIDIGLAREIEGAECDAIVSPVSALEEETLLGQPFLGERILCGHSRLGCRNDPQVCAVSRREGEV
jgi:hypothetical protein